MAFYFEVSSKNLSILNFPDLFYIIVLEFHYGKELIRLNLSNNLFFFVRFIIFFGLIFYFPSKAGKKNL